MKKVNYNKNLLEKNVKNCYSFSELCRKLGLKPEGSNIKTVKMKLNQYGINYSHFTGQRWNVNPNNPVYIKKYYPLLTINSSLSSTNVKNLLYRLGLKTNICECCGINYWNNKPLVCELHHINGDTTDNRIENLQILCPNCHSQTFNYKKCKLNKKL